MTYRVEQWVSKIESPVSVRIGDNVLNFSSGEELAAFTFDRQYEVKSISAVGSTVEIELTPKITKEPFNFAGEAALG